MINTMGSYEYRGTHAVHDKVEALSNENQQLRDLIKDLFKDTSIVNIRRCRSRYASIAKND